MTKAKKNAALVTGASSGLGKELALLFAKDGYDLVLVARGEEKLRSLASDLGAAHGVVAHVVAADLSDPSAPGRIFDRVRELGVEVDFLVNNAGFGSNGP